MFVVKALIAQSLLSLIVSTLALVTVYCVLLLLLRALRQEDVDIAQAAMQKAYVPQGLLRIATSALKGAVGR